MTGTAAMSNVARVKLNRIRRPQRVDWRWRLVALAALSLLLAVAIISATSVDADTGGDVIGLGRLVGHDLLRLRWQYALVVLALAGLHYLAAAVAARAAAGVPLPLGETLAVQLAAATADRLTPGGVGSAAVNARYFTRRGLELPVAVGAVAALHVFGPVTDLAVLAVLIFAGRFIGLAGAGHEVGVLVAQAGHLVAPLRSPRLWLIGSILVFGLLLARRFRPARTKRDWTGFWTPVRELVGRPSRLATVAVGSAATTLILAFAFAASVAMTPGPQPAASVGALLIAFMVGNAAGGAAPVPAGLGATEAALVAVLVGLRVPPAAAVQQVLVFRVVTFWLPAAIGLVAARRLRRRAAL